MMTVLKKRKQKGFTLIELLIIVAVIAILATIAIPRYISSQETSRGAKIIADMKTVDNAITVYMAQNNSQISPTFVQLTTNPEYLSFEPHPPFGLARFPNGGTYDGGGDYVITSGRCALSDGRLVENLIQ